MSDKPISLSDAPAGYTDWLGDIKNRFTRRKNVPRKR